MGHIASDQGIQLKRLYRTRIGNFLTRNKLFLLMLFLSVGLAIGGLFYPCKTISLIGIILSLLISVWNKWVSFKKIENLSTEQKETSRRVDGYDAVFQIKRDDEGNIVGYTHDYGTYD